MRVLMHNVALSANATTSGTVMSKISFLVSNKIPVRYFDLHYDSYRLWLPVRNDNRRLEASSARE